MAMELPKKSISDLYKTLEEKRNALRTFRFEMAGSRTRNVKEGRAAKKDIARILTEINSRSHN